MPIKLTKHPFVHIHKGLTLCSLILGYVNPNIHEVLPLRKSLGWILHFIKVPCLVFVTVVLIDYLVTVANLLITKNLGMMVHQCLGFLAAFSCLHRLTVVLCYEKSLTSCFSYFDTLLSSHARNKWKWSVIMKNRGTVRRMALVYLSASLFTTALANSFFIYKNHQSPRIWNIPGPWYMKSFYTFVWSFAAQLWQVAYHWNLMTLMALPTSELKILRSELEQIFSTIYMDEDGEVKLNKILVKKYQSSYKPKDQEDKQEEVNINISFREVEIQEDEPFPQTSRVTARNPIFNAKTHKTHIYYVDQALNAWVRRHDKVIRHCKIVRKIFSGSIMISYIMTIVGMTTLIYLNTSVKGSKIPMSTMLYSLMNLIILYFDCQIGNDLTETSENVCSEVYDREWCVYPASLQNKLLFIMQMSRQRPISVSMYGLHPLNRKSFYEVLKSAYSMFSFLSGTVKVD